MANQISKTIDANPTKELFISMLVKDITLKDAIGDLVDNCIDGLHRMNVTSDFGPFYIHITISENEFTIKDNCGGITYLNAKDNVFRFGRTEDTPIVDNSIGQFGIGMKRALFKMGRTFRIESVSERDSFSIAIDLKEWKKDKNSWNFIFQDVDILEAKDPDNRIEKRGTTIKVTNLNSEIKEMFNLENFIRDLIDEISLEQYINISRGLKIKINKTNLKTDNSLDLIFSENFIPCCWKHEFDGGLNAKAIVGISDRDLGKGGWYIFCNDRMVLGPEQSIVSIWGAIKPCRIPKYHNQFDRFRGYVFFESKDSRLLPWNTSKNNMDIDAPTYRSMRQEMITKSRQVIDFLNNIHEENQLASDEEKIINEMLNADSNQKIKLWDIIQKLDKFPNKFSFPESSTLKPKTVNISYSKPKEQVDLIKKQLQASSNKEVGEKTFDYFFSSEIEE